MNRPVPGRALTAAMRRDGGGQGITPPLGVRCTLSTHIGGSAYHGESGPAQRGFLSELGLIGFGKHKKGGTVTRSALSLSVKTGSICTVEAIFI